MCINTKCSMSIIEKVFHYEETWVPVIKYKDEIWFKAVAVATILRYKNTIKSICDHVDPEDKRKLSEFTFPEFHYATEAKVDFPSACI